MLMVNNSLKYKKGQKALTSSRVPETDASFAHAGSRKNLPGENSSHEPAQGLVLTAVPGRWESLLRWDAERPYLSTRSSRIRGSCRYAGLLLCIPAFSIEPNAFFLPWWWMESYCRYRFARVFPVKGYPHREHIWQIMALCEIVWVDKNWGCLMNYG